MALPHLAVVSIIINNSKQILLIKRHSPDNNESHEKWHFPGGGIEIGEHPIETVEREMLEEVNLICQPLSDTPFIESYMRAHSNQLIILGYPYLYFKGDVDISKDKSSSEYKWFKESEIPYDKCLPKTKELINKSFKLL